MRGGDLEVTEGEAETALQRIANFGFRTGHYGCTTADSKIVRIGFIEHGGRRRYVRFFSAGTGIAVGLLMPSESTKMISEVNANVIESAITIDLLVRNGFKGVCESLNLEHMPIRQQKLMAA